MKGLKFDDFIWLTAAATQEFMSFPTQIFLLFYLFLFLVLVQKLCLWLCFLPSPVSYPPAPAAFQSPVPESRS